MEGKVNIDRDFFDGQNRELKSSEQTVKNLEIKKIRPSIFIGSSTESHFLAEKIQSYFNSELLEVDTWKMDIFGQKDDEGNRLTNAEQLKNFTDIYDFAIFLFTPDDKLISQTRSDLKGNRIVAHATRHNVVFEFGLFLGRIGAERSYILYDDDIADFIEYFFTDLAENLSNKHNVTNINKVLSKDFKIEAISYKGKYLEYIKNKDRKYAFDEDDLRNKILQLEERIILQGKKISLGFLPSTSLAKGYYNNFLKQILKGYKTLVEKTEIEEEKKRSETIDLAPYIENKKNLLVYIVIPDDLFTAEYSENRFEELFGNSFFGTGTIPTGKGTRKVTVYFDNSSIYDESDCVIVYDIPTTMNSSISAIDLTTNHKDIKELLSEKERRNFEKVIQHEIGVRSFIRTIDWSTFLGLTGIKVTASNK